MLKIGDFSKLSRLSVRMLRHYDELGLLVPLSTDPFTGYRYYAEEQLAAAAHIAALRAMGFSLVEIGALACAARRPLLDYCQPLAMLTQPAKWSAAVCSSSMVSLTALAALPAAG